MGVRWIVLLAGLAGLAARPADARAQGTFEADARPLVKKFCLECHSAEEQEAELDLERFATADQAREAPRVWQRVAEVLAAGEMPPKESPQPDAGERAKLSGWVRRFLADEAVRRQGDPGRVVLRRLNNAEYTYTLRDLTGLDALDPAREFPADGAAGEGFTNTGNALVMSPSLVTKYLDAAKAVAAHAVLQPDGVRFSAGTTSRDWTEEILAEIRGLYREFTGARPGGERVDMTEQVVETNLGGGLPVARYLEATLVERVALASGARSFAAVAAERGLNAKYLGTLWATLHDPSPTFLIADLQARWRSAAAGDGPSLVAEVNAWQKALWAFHSVGHIGKLDGPKAWMTPTDPVAARRDVRFKIPASPDGSPVTLSLITTDAGDGPAGDVAVWQSPRLVAAGRPDLLLRDVRGFAAALTAGRARLFADTARYLDAAAEADAAAGKADVATLAGRRGIDPAMLHAWLDFLGIAPADALRVTGRFEGKVAGVGGYPFISGWAGNGEALSLLANPTDQAVRIPGRMKPHGVAVHPSPNVRAAVGWQGPVGGAFRVEARVEHAHPECGNGVTWALDLRRGATRRRLASGIAQGGTVGTFATAEPLTVQAGDLVALAIGPRDGNFGCDLTAVDLRVTDASDPARVWDLAADVSGGVQAGNPHADRQGHPGVWHFYGEPDDGSAEAPPGPPEGSVLARWRAARDPAERTRLAAEAQRLLAGEVQAPAGGPDAAVVKRLRSLGGPLLSELRPGGGEVPAGAEAWGPDPALSGAGAGAGAAGGSPDLLVRGAAAVTFRLPAELADGADLVAGGVLDPVAGAEGSVQFDVVAGQPPADAGPRPGVTTVALAGATWTSTTKLTSSSSPIVVNDGSATRARVLAAFDAFRNVFPAALCYEKVVPVDEVVTLTLFYREDHHLARLMLDDAQKARLDRLWDELHFVSRDALTLVDAYAQLMEYATQDANPKVFEPLREPIRRRAEDFRARLVASEPAQLDAVLAFASRAYRRPLSDGETGQLRDLYRTLRAEEIPHDEAVRLTLARVLVAPAFLYRLETPVEGSGQGPVTGHELATRLSYFLWSSTPDAELGALADAGRLNDPEVLAAQTRRMLRDPKVRRLADEFAGHWVHVADFARHDGKSERHFPTFLGLRDAMAEETSRFFTDLFQSDGSVLGVVDADHTFLNRPLADHYGIPFEGTDPNVWRRVDGIRAFGRGGVLGQATTLASQSGASRTSPTLRGNWVSEVLLGERLPRPPKGVPLLPDDEAATDGLTVRQLVEKHANDAKCMNCHRRIDPMGFSLEAFDPIGRLRTRDLGGRPVDTRARAADGTEFDGLAGLANYLTVDRRDAFLKQFCRKLLGFALGRSTGLSDEPLMAEMRAALDAREYRVGAAVDAVVRSRQFREIRGRATADAD